MRLSGVHWVAYERCHVRDLLEPEIGSYEYRIDFITDLGSGLRLLL